MTPKTSGEAGVELIGGDYLVRFEARTLDDIRALGGNDAEDERKFSAVARVSEINLGLYRMFVQPWVRSWANEDFARWMRTLHPLRLQYEMLSHANPLMQPMLSWIDAVHKNRQPVAPDNAYWRAQEQFSTWMETSLNVYRDMRDQAYEAWFNASPRRRPGTDAAHRALVAQHMEELRAGITKGGPREAVLRALLYVRMPEGAVDERSFNLLRRMREEAGKSISLATFKQILRQQFFMLLLDERRAVEAIPAMLARDPELAARMTSNARRLIEVVGVSNKESKARLAEVKALFEGKVVREAAARAHVSAIRRSRPVRPDVERQ
jgi:hypothetical protein